MIKRVTKTGTLHKSKSGANVDVNKELTDKAIQYNP